jgi:hypothetical protein
MPEMPKEIRREIKREAGLLGMPDMWRFCSVQLLGEKKKKF